MSLLCSQLIVGTARRGFLSALVLVAACNSSNKLDASPKPAVGAANMVDSTARPILVSFRRDSLKLATNASTELVRSVLDSAVARLHRTMDFEVTAISTPILLVRVRARKEADTEKLLAFLKKDSAVQAAEFDGVAKPMSGGN